MLPTVGFFFDRLTSSDFQEIGVFTGTVSEAKSNCDVNSEASGSSLNSLMRTVSLMKSFGEKWNSIFAARGSSKSRSTSILVTWSSRAWSSSSMYTLVDTQFVRACGQNPSILASTSARFFRIGACSLCIYLAISTSAASSSFSRALISPCTALGIIPISG